MKKLFPLNDNIGSVQLIEHMGSDLTIINDARVSYGKQKKEIEPNDVKLIDYLLKHQHYSPLRGVVFKFLVVAPLFVCRQWWRHSIASCHVEEQRGWNEQSLRYVEVSDQFYVPVMRSQSALNKQGSVEILISQDLQDKYKDFTNACYQFYQLLLSEGVSREIARTVLPNCIYTQFRWTVSFQSLLYFIQLRDSSDSQWEIQQYAVALENLIEPYVPYTVNAYKHYATNQKTS
jgi:thymidylate synthase (FAD)